MPEDPKGFFQRLKHAFHVEKAVVADPDEKTAATIEKICDEIVRRQMVVPALMLLEMSRPLNYLGAQALHFFQPFGTVLIDPRKWQGFAKFLEERGSVEYLIEALEAANNRSKSEPPASEEPEQAGDGEESAHTPLEEDSGQPPTPEH